MISDTQKLVLEVSQGNPGALTVIIRLEWFSKWFEMLKWLKKNNLVGGALWAKYKDEFHQDVYKFGYWVEGKMLLERESEHLFLQGTKFPRF